jgi:hypothetical protein
MTTFEQALHIFRKDSRHLRFEIAGVLILFLILVLSGVQSWESLQERGSADPDSEGPLSVLLPIAWCLLIARAIQTEALPGDRHFWLTRPYSRTGLILSKALFIGAFINLPFLVAQAAIVVFDGLPLFTNLSGLLWNQLLVTVLLLLPVAAIAALTRNLAQFLPAVVLCTGLLAVPAFEHNSFGDLEWIRSIFGFTIVFAIAALVLWRQYRLRRSGNTAFLALGATVAGVILYLSLPHSLAFGIQSKLIGSRDSQFALRLAPAEPRKADTQTPNRYQQRLALPIAVSGPGIEDLHISALRVTFKTLSGITRHQSSKVDVKDKKLVQTSSLDRTFFDAAKDAPVSLQAEYYVIQFANVRSTEVPLDGTPVYIAGPGQCGVVAGYDQRTFVCRSAFRRPKPFVSERIEGPEEHHRRWDSYSPFPAQLRIYPVVARTYRLLGRSAGELAPAVPERPATLSVREPVAYFRYKLEAANVRLADYAISEPKEDESQ